MQSRTPRKVKAMLILWTVGRKLMSNPNFHATMVALVWASIHFRYIRHIKFGITINVIILETCSLLKN